jgi:D-alanyl-D-alanine carboxypeptidase/D-alanyl-D-alanine-endopeptidase (penicillin-binding protein 4)
VRNLLKTSPPDVPPSLAVRRLPGSTTLEVRGSVPAGSARTVRNVSVDNPTLYFVAALRDALIADGIDIRGPAVDIDEIADPPSRERGTVLLTHRSPPLSMLAETMVKLSQNLYAETLLKSLGASAGAGTADAGRSAAVSVVREWGVTPADLVMADGSGLSRYNLATPEAIVTILTHVDRDDRLRTPFEAALPVAGRDGTLAQRMRGTVAEGNARAKTGSFSNARALSGYVRTADDEPLVFSIIVNNFGTTPTVVEQTMDWIVVRLASFRR